MKTVKVQTTKASADKLHALLVKMAEGLEKLYDCLRTQQAALLKWDFSAFSATIRQQERLVRENLEREKKRIALVSEIAGEKGTEKLSLRQLAESLGGEWPDRFEKLAGRIKTASGKVSSMKDQNESVIINSRKLVNDQLILLLELARLNRNLYEGSGKKSVKANMHKVLDQKA
jgi:hypothetical protein